MHDVNNNVKFDIQDVLEAYSNKKKYDFLTIPIVDNAPIYNPTRFLNVMKASKYYFCFQTHNSVLRGDAVCSGRNILTFRCSILPETYSLNIQRLHSSKP